MSEKRKSPGHTGLMGKDVACFNCGKRETVIHGDGIAVNTPAWYGLTAHIQAFEKVHAKCPPRPRGIADLEPDVEAWERGLHVGLSSATIYFVMMGRWPSMGPWRASTPSDPSDLGRCLRLLAIRPDWEERLSEVADRFPDWKPLVAAWPELRASMADEVGIFWEKGDRAPKTYALMKSLGL